MAKVALRIYNREVEGMIEAGQLDESVAHCLHILKTFPMHVETYRLLGKSFLEARRYADAADIFQRTLMAVPDDFVAHVGMSIIRGDEGKLEDAIWHMERAFEDQPSNPAIQNELRRLYGRRDGVEPPKIRLSRDALANMYAHGELFNQAIAEIRAVLAEDADRPDLQVMLARAYYRAGKKAEAAEMAANLVKKYTYCMDALRILVDVLPGDVGGENLEVYRQRLRMLDPYSSFVNGSVFSTDQVADEAVNLERLEYRAGVVPALSKPNWASWLGIKLADEKHIEPAADRRAAGESAEQPLIAVPDSSEAAAAPAADDKSVPNWMHSADLQASIGKAQEKPADFGDQQPAEPLAQAELPDRFKTMAPQEPTTANVGIESAPANSPPPSKGDSPDWLAGPGTTAMDANPETSQPANSTQGENAFPDWLKETDNSPSAGNAAAFADEALEQPQAEETPASTQPAPQSPANQAPANPPVSKPITNDATPFQPTGEPRPLKIEDEAMAWLEGLAAKQGAKEEELLARPENRSIGMPGWLSSADGQPPTSIAPETPASHETQPSEPPTPFAGESAVHEPAPFENLTPRAPAEETAQPLNSAPDTAAWLESSSAGQGDQREELTPIPDGRSEPPPDWIQKTTQEPAAPDETLAPGFAPATSDEDVSITSWLRKLGTQEAMGKYQSAPDSSLPAAEPANDLPDWLKELDEPAASTEAPHPAEDLPDRLSGPVQPADQGVPAPEIPSLTETPSWADETNTVPEPPAPTVPGEWIPVDEKNLPEPNFKPIAEPASPPDTTSVQPLIPKDTGTPTRVAAEDKDAKTLATAQAALAANHLNEAMQVYARLIKKNRLLEEVIQDLREALSRFPVDIIVWQTLGDACMRAKRLQDALDAYTKAEEFLR